MIHFVTGKPGGGKGRFYAESIIERVRGSDLPFLSNFALELLPWVNGKHQAQMGLLAYLRREFKRTYDIENRWWRLTDEQIAEFYRFRPVRNQKTGLFELREADCSRVPLKEGGTKITSFDPSLLALGGCFIYVDESARFWGSRHWQRTGDGLLFYAEQHRKVSDEVFIGCQHTKQIDAAIQRVAQDFYVCRNKSLLRVGVFRQSDNFVCEVYEDVPNGSVMQKPMQKFHYKLDPKGVAQTFDTSGGVGLAGRMGGDIGAKKQGLPYWLLWVCACLIPIVAYFGINWLLKHGTGSLLRGLGLGPPAVLAHPFPAVTNATPARPRPVQVVTNSGGFRSSVVAPPVVDDVTMSGCAFLQGVWRVLLSDGRVMGPENGLQVLAPDHSFCIVSGRRYDMTLKRPSGNDNPGNGWRPSRDALSDYRAGRVTDRQPLAY